MKSIKICFRLFILFTLPLVLMLSSCKKEKEVCAKCVETTIMFHADDFCDTPSQVDWYVENLVKEGAALGQNWVCTIE